MSKCKICGFDLQPVMDLGKMPIANGFISKIGEKEFFYDLIVGFCPKCFMVQLINTVPAEKMFNADYHFISSTSSAMALHFKEIAEEIVKKISFKKSPFIVELGCNDGIMLEHIAKNKISHLGIEPSKNVADLARKKGIEVTEEFFNRGTAQKIVQKYGQADIICGSNVMCHIENINSVFEGVNVLLKDDGVLFFEDPYLLDIAKKSSFDQIYDEHVYYFSGLSILELAKKHNLFLVDMIHQDVHGGSMRYYIQKNKSLNPKNAEDWINQEKSFNLHQASGYLEFKHNVDKICKDLNELLGSIKREGGRIVGYGATSKSTTLLNYAGIGPEFIDYISDITPTKINRYTPGTHIPIKSHEIFASDNQRHTLLFAWNHKDEIFKKEQDYRAKGGKFITYFPRVVVE